jgi:hypothetical protein
LPHHCRVRLLHLHPAAVLDLVLRIILALILVLIEIPESSPASMSWQGFAFAVLAPIVFLSSSSSSGSGHPASLASRAALSGLDFTGIHGLLKECDDRTRVVG